MDQDTEIIFADFCFDGGTTDVQLKRGEVVIHASFDYSLPWDGRARLITIREQETERKIQLGSSEEKEICESVRSALDREYGVEAVNSALRWMSEHELLDRAKRLSSLAHSEMPSSIEAPPVEIVPFLGTPSGIAIKFVHLAIVEGKILM